MDDNHRISIHGTSNMEDEEKSLMGQTLDDDGYMERMLAQAGFLAEQMRAAAGGLSLNTDTNSPKLHQKITIPDTIEMQDNQTECSSIGLGYAYEYNKWSPSAEYAAIPEGNISPSDNEASNFDFSSRVTSKDETSFQPSRSPRHKKRNIEDLVKKSKASVQLTEENIKLTIDSFAGLIPNLLPSLEKAHEKPPLNHYRQKRVSSRTSKRFTNEDERSTLASVGTTYHDASNVEHEEKKCEEEAVTLSSMLNSMPKVDSLEVINVDGTNACSNHDTMNRIDVIDQIEILPNNSIENLHIASEIPSTQPNRSAMIEVQPHTKDPEILPYNLPILVEKQSPMYHNPDDSRIMKTVSCLIEERGVAEPRNGILDVNVNVTSSWEKTSSKQVDVDDYAPVSNFSTNVVIKEEPILAGSPSRKNDFLKVKWEQLKTANIGDEDYVRIKDYSSLRQNGSELLLYNRDSNSPTTFASKRALLKRNRQRRRRLYRFVIVVLLFCGCLYYFGPSIVLVNVLSTMSLIISNFMEKLDVLSRNWQSSKNVMKGDNNQDIEPPVSEKRVTFNYYFSEPEMCSSECLFFYGDSSYDIVVPQECIGIPEIEVISDLESQAEVVTAIEKLPSICTVPLLSDIIPQCRMAKRRRKRRNK